MSSKWGYEKLTLMRELIINTSDLIRRKALYNQENGNYFYIAMLRIKTTRGASKKTTFA